MKRISPGKIEPKEYVKDGVNYVKPRQTENIIKITNRHISIMHISITRITNKLISSIIKITNRHISTVLPVIMRIIYNISMDCGHDDIRVLEFDHIHGRKKRSISRMLSIDCPWSTIQAEINKCEVRCANCHRIKTNERGGLWRSLLDRYTNPSAHKKSQLLLHEYLSTHPCIDCSRNNILVLEFDHVHGSKKANVAAMARDERPWSTIQAEINKCEVRCANCHRTQHH